jgi:hypothetical protein
MMMPQQPTTDFIAQLVVPLTDGAGWGGVSLGSDMTGPLLLATWYVLSPTREMMLVFVGHLASKTAVVEADPQVAG